MSQPPATKATRALDRRLIRQAGPARGYLIATAGLGLVTTGLIVAQAWLLAVALSTVARGTGLAALQGTLIALALVVLARAGAAYSAEASALNAAAVVKSQLRRRLTAHAVRLGPSWLSRQRAGEITTLATRGLDALDSYFSRYLPQLLLACVVPLTVLAVVTEADWLSGVIIAGTLPLIPLFAALVGMYTRDRTNRQWRLLARLGGHFTDVVAGLTTLKAFGRAKAQAEIIKSATNEHRSATMAALRVAFLSALVLELAAALATALVAVEVGLRLLAGHIGYQTALLVLLLTPEAYLPLRSLGAQFHASAEGTAAADRAFEILDVPAQEPDRDARTPALRPAADLDICAAPLELSEVSLAYPGRDAPALDRVSLVISPGERTMLTGPSGAGKTSLLSLLLRFAEPTSGLIEAGGVSLGDIPLGPWRRQIAWVPQAPYLFAGTIADNIALGLPGAALEAIWHAADLAGAMDFVDALPGGLHAQLAERGRNLSAGQRQRIALARAFLRDSPLVLLDEPTAHLDPVSAMRVLGVIEQLAAGRTVLMASHRNYPPTRSWKVVRLDHGRLSPAPSAKTAARSRLEAVGP